MSCPAPIPEQGSGVGKQALFFESLCELVVGFLRVILFTELTLLISNFKYRVNKKKGWNFFCLFSFLLCSIY